MENKYFETSDVKEKFALLISKLNEAGFLLDYINDTIIKSSFFDCFENNDLNDFMNLSFETITERIFGKEVVFSQMYNPINPYYWAGQTAMEIMMNYKVPLKRILLIMPLKEIVGSYTVYHEMNPIKFCEYYLQKEREKSIFKKLRRDNNLSIPNVSFLTAINPSILKIFDKSNDTLLSTSFRNIKRLANLFSLSSDVFKKESDYLPFSKYLINSKEFGSILCRNIMTYYGFDSAKFLTINHYYDDKEIKVMLIDNKVIVDVSNPFGVIFYSSRKLTHKYLNEKEFYYIYRNTVNDVAEYIDGLLF